MPIAPDDVAAFLDSVLEELRSSKSAAIRVARVTALLDMAERRLDTRSLFRSRSGGKGGHTQ